MKIVISGGDTLVKKLKTIKNLEFAKKTVKKHGALLQKKMKQNATP